VDAARADPGLQVLPKTSPTPQEEDPDKEKPKKLMIFVQPEEVTINFTNVDPVAVPPVTFKKVDGDLNKQVREHIKKVSNDTALVVDKKKQAVVIASSDTVEYRQIIETMDILIDNGLPGLSLADANVVKGMLPDDPNAPPPGGAPSPAPRSEPEERASACRSSPSPVNTSSRRSPGVHPQSRGWARSGQRDRRSERDAHGGHAHHARHLPPAHVLRER
jgi:biopolymer transport protein ExbD